MLPEPDPHAPHHHDHHGALARALPCALVALDGRGRVTEWNPAAEAWFGVRAEHALGRAAGEAGLPGEERWAPLVESARAGGEAGGAEPVRVGPGGAAGRWVEFRAAPAGGEGEVLLLAHDVTALVEARRQAERRAGEEAALREAMVAASSSLVPDEVFAALCPRIRSLLGAGYVSVDLPLMEGRRHWCGEENVPPALREALPALLRRVREGGEPLLAGGGAEGGELAAEAVPGGGCALLLPLRPEGEPAGVLVAGWEGETPPDAGTTRLAALLAAQAAVAFRNASLYVALKEAAGRRDRFFSAMSHDLRTPITAIVGYSELLQDGIVGELEERQQEMVERISQVASQLSQLVNDILDLAKLDAGRMEFHLEEVRLGELVEEAVVTVEPQAQSKALALRLDVDGFREEVLRVDRPRVRQILVNLFSNAVKFTDRGEVCVTAGTAPDRSWIEVRDTGPGIPAGSEEMVFEEFLQIASGNRSKREPGSGLGLAISRRLARAMGGELVARSEPGSGAVFTLYLPVGGEG